MKVLVNYNFTPEKDWIGDDYIIYDRSDGGADYLKDFDQSKIIKTENVGQVDYDKLSYIVDNYYDLPDVFLWGKTNLFKFITPEEYEEVKDNKVFTPLLTKGHKTYSDNNGPVCYYAQDIYWERNNNWYLNQFATKYFNSYGAFAHEFQISSPPYLPFAPGGNYILTRENIHRYSRDYYVKMANVLPYACMPGEAYFCERAYYTIWR